MLLGLKVLVKLDGTDGFKTDDALNSSAGSRLYSAGESDCGGHPRCLLSSTIAVQPQGVTYDYRRWHDVRYHTPWTGSRISITQRRG